MADAWDARFEKVLRSVLPNLDADAPLQPDLRLPALGLTSLVIVELLTRLEREYEFELPDELLNFQIFATPATLWEAFAKALSRTVTEPDAG